MLPNPQKWKSIPAQDDCSRKDNWVQEGEVNKSFKLCLRECSGDQLKLALSAALKDTGWTCRISTTERNMETWWNAVALLWKRNEILRLLVSGHMVSSLMAQWGKESACQCKRCRFDPLVREDPLEKGMATHSSVLDWRIPLACYSLWGHKESDTTEHTYTHTQAWTPQPALYN